MTPLLEARGIAKGFPNGTVALHGVDLAVEPGRVLALVGANGAGKSTLIRILSGAMPASGGELRWQGQPVRFRRPIEAKRAGISTIHQHLPLVPTLSVAENVLLDRGGIARVRDADRREVADLLARLDCTFGPDARVGDLRIGDRQMVAIAAALAGDARLVIMDEPTAALAGHERQAVHRMIRALADDGRAVLFISHFLDEITGLSDRVAVLRDGRIVLDADAAGLTEADVAAAIAGRRLAALERSDRPRATGAPMLSVSGLATSRLTRTIDLTVGAGEIVGLAGLLGAGRSEVLHAVFGADRRRAGEVRLDGVAVGASVEEAVAAGIALVAEDRMHEGLVAGFDIRGNIALPEGGWLIDHAAERIRAADAVTRLAIKAPGIDTGVADLSGGNAQKVTIARWLRPQTRVLLLDEPTAGIDIGARTEILRLIRALADDGLAILLVSSDFSELLTLADRILVLRDRRVVAERAADTLDEDTLILLASTAGQHNREAA